MIHPTPPASQRSAAGMCVDMVATALCWILLMAGAGFMLLFAPLMVMATDACAYQDCREHLATYGVYVAWGGAAAAVAVAGIGTLVAAVKERTAGLFVWPLLGLGVLFAAFYLDMFLTDAALHR